MNIIRNMWMLLLFLCELSFCVSPNPKWTFALADKDLDGIDDLYAIRIDSVGSNVAYSILSGKSNYTFFLAQNVKISMMTPAPNQYVFLVGDKNADSVPDIWAIRKYGSGSKVTEAFVYNGKNGELLDSEVVYNGLTSSNWDFVLDKLSDGIVHVIAIKKDVPDIGAELYMNVSNRKKSYTTTSMRPSYLTKVRIPPVSNASGMNRDILFVKMGETSSYKSEIQYLNGKENYKLCGECGQVTCLPMLNPDMYEVLAGSFSDKYPKPQLFVLTTNSTKGGMVALSVYDTSSTNMLLLDSAFIPLSGADVPLPLPTLKENIADAWEATDALDRRIPGGDSINYSLREKKYVGMFYWTWHGDIAKSKQPAKNLANILEQYPWLINDSVSDDWERVQYGNWYYWGEPLFGYYRGDNDDWVLRKHAEMLADAGVDFVAFDCTNNSIYEDAYTRLFNVWEQALKDGIRVPKVAFMLPFHIDGTGPFIDSLYKNVYRKNLWADLWFKWRGKPLIMAYPDSILDDHDSAENTLHREINDFFTFRPVYSLMDKRSLFANQWAWLQIAPQEGFGLLPQLGQYEMLSVGVAQNYQKKPGESTGCVKAMNAPYVFGRGYTNAHGFDTSERAINGGFNFQEQWDQARSIDPDLVFVTGWNEWITCRTWRFGNDSSLRVTFSDEFSPSRSRDIEPMNGMLGDNYYYQLVSNVRRFKGFAKQEHASERKKIDINDFSMWNDVKPSFFSHRGDTVMRNGLMWCSQCNTNHNVYDTSYYANSSARNSIVRAAVARDYDSLYFLGVAQRNIVIPNVSDNNWMRLYIDIDRKRKTGWEGYDYMIEPIANTPFASLFKNSGNWQWTRLASVRYSVKDSDIAIAVPRKLLGVQETKMDFEFKWADNSGDSGKVLDFWSIGSVSPPGRFNWRFQENSMPDCADSYAEGSSDSIHISDVVPYSNGNIKVVFDNGNSVWVDGALDGAEKLKMALMSAWKSGKGVLVKATCKWRKNGEILLIGMAF